MKRPSSKLESVTSGKKRKSSAQRSNNGKKAANSRSASRSKDRAGGYTLQELEKREKNLQSKLNAKKEKEGSVSGRGRTYNTSRNKRNQNIAEKGRSNSKERSLSQRTFQKMNAAGHSNLLAAQRVSQ